MPAKEPFPESTLTASDSKKNQMDDDDDSGKEEDNINSFSASTKLLEKRKEMMDVQGLLEQKRNEYSTRMDLIKKKEKHLLTKKQELTENVKELDKFIGDNIIKKKRADQKKDMEQSERLKSEKTILECRNQIKELEKEKERKEHQLNTNYIKYQQFLQKVVQFRGEDINPEDVEKVIDRYMTLKEKNEELSNEKSKFSLKLAREKNKLMEEKEAMKNKKVKLNHMISKLGKQLEMLVDERNKLDSHFDLKSSTATRDKRQFGQIEMAINNLYNRVTTTGGSRIPRHCKITVTNTQALNEMYGSNVIMTKLLTGSGNGAAEVTIESYKRFNNMEVLMKMMKVIGDCLSDYSLLVDHLRKMPEKEREAHKKQKT
ncbi:hypothetical protein C9374_004906 [Naegleria lovaniensis]|uniref:DUF4200 domain-containing protein n=1 Tax=Naegleria lovaniensis TaxID=51637 RepID=A0AA88KIL2_NAELO|nr:uncharacterized protein C9374_004906 [Naegleria lovaniensis]KAG2382939.1 hypothetical protein C9374_004906 [Naegleria lovaniensis]